MITTLNVTTFLLGILFMYMAGNKSRYTNYILLTLTLLNLWMNGLMGLYADTIKDVVITVPLTLYAIVNWRKLEKGTPEEGIVSGKAPLRYTVTATLAGLIMWVVLYNIMGHIQVTLLGFNTAIVVLNILYMMYHGKVYTEAWIIHILLNLLYVIQYGIIWGLSFDFGIIVLKNIYFTYLAIKGYKQWNIRNVVQNNVEIV